MFELQIGQYSITDTQRFVIDVLWYWLLIQIMGLIWKSTVYIKIIVFILKAQIEIQIMGLFGKPAILKSVQIQ